MGCEPSLLDNGISNGNVYKQMIKKPTQIHFLSKRPHNIIKMNDNIKIGQYNSRICWLKTINYSYDKNHN